VKSTWKPELLIPADVGEAVEMRKEAGPASLYLAGGTTVVLRASPAVRFLVDTADLGLTGLSVDTDFIRAQAGVRLSDLAAEDLPAGLRTAARRCATPRIRNMATVGGSLAGIRLPSDPGIAMLALGGEVHLAGGETPVMDLDALLGRGWLTGYELLSEVRLYRLREGEGSGFAKVAKARVDIGLVNAACRLSVSGGKVVRIRLAVGHTFGAPLLLTDSDLGETDRALGHEAVRKLSGRVRELLSPRRDFRAGAEYRKHASEVAAGRAIYMAAREAGYEFGD
jgi:CO/xanthine dehydrogenase FAD-binding subunit